MKLTSSSYTTFSAGPRFYFGNRVTGFVHALFGVIRTNGDVELSESFLEAVQVVLPPGITDVQDALDVTESEFMMQPGGGIDFRVTDTMAIRGQVDCQWFTSLEDTDANIRFVVAGVL